MLPDDLDPARARMRIRACGIRGTRRGRDHRWWRHSSQSFAYLICDARSARDYRSRLRRDVETGSALVRDDVLQEPARPEEVRQRGAVLVARQPRLAALGRVDLGVVPQQRPTWRRPGSPWRSRSARSRSIGASLDVGDRPEMKRCRTATGEAVRHLECDLRRGMLGSRERSLHAGRVKTKHPARACRRIFLSRRGPRRQFMGACAVRKRESVVSRSPALAITTAK